MSQLLIRKLDHDLEERLRRRAREHGRSMEEEARRILEDVIGTSDGAQHDWATCIAAEFADIGFTEEEAAKLELKGSAAYPARLE